jgi:hypothetical protein
MNAFSFLLATMREKSQEQPQLSMHGASHESGLTAISPFFQSNNLTVNKYNIETLINEEERILNKKIKVLIAHIDVQSV